MERISGYIEKTLLAREDILYKGHIHWVIFAMPMMWTLLTLVLAYQHSIIELLALITSVAAVFTWVTALVTYQTSEYALTNKRVLIKTGFIRRDSLETFLHKIEGIQVTQSVWGRLLNYGTIVIIGTGGTRDPFSTIESPIQFRKQVQQQIEKLLTRNDQG